MYDSRIISCPLQQVDKVSHGTAGEMHLRYKDYLSRAYTSSGVRRRVPACFIEQLFSLLPLMLLRG